VVIDQGGDKIKRVSIDGIYRIALPGCVDVDAVALCKARGVLHHDAVIALGGGLGKGGVSLSRYSSGPAGDDSEEDG
jgi:hypothetical protein